MPILINRYFEIVTEKSAEDGEAAESGALAENEPMTFRELVSAMQGGVCSCYPARGGTDEWLSVDEGETRAWFERGERETHTLHYSRDNPPRMARYWKLAMRAAGVAK